MKLKSFIVSLLSLCTLYVHGQTSLLENTLGITAEKVVFYEAEGYSIFVQDFDQKLDEKGINKVKRKFSIPANETAKEDNNFPNAKILRSEEIKGTSKTQNIYYIAAPEPGRIKVIGFSTICERDISIEKQFYEAVVNYAIPPQVFTPMMVDTIRFAGRSIDLGPACHWRGVRNIQCPDLGQMNWSEFSDSTRAKQMIIAQQAINASMKMGDVLEDKQVEVIFEGKTVTALKRKLKIKIPQFIMGGSNILIIYYVTAEIRGRYVACVLSHYTYETKAEKLPPLLREVMQVKE